MVEAPEGALAVALQGSERAQCEYYPNWNARASGIRHVEGDFKMGAGSTLTSTTGGIIRINVGGRIVRLSQNTVVYASIVAPNAKIKMQRDATLFGCTCTNQASMDKRINLTCVASPGGAFLD